MTTFPEHFLWGAATAGHQIEGNNVNSDWWAREQQMPGMELSGDACDSYHRYAEDIQLLADAGLSSYRFSLEWSRIEPIRGHFSRAELAHYRRVIDACLDRGITPVVTLQHFTTPQWFAEAGGWSGPDAQELFVRYVERACTILDGVEWVATMNEPNMQAAIMTLWRGWRSRADSGRAPPSRPSTPATKRVSRRRATTSSRTPTRHQPQVRRNPPRGTRGRPSPHGCQGRLDDRRRRADGRARWRRETPRDPLRQGGHLLGGQPGG